MGESPSPESGRRSVALAASKAHSVDMRRRQILIVDSHPLVRRGLTELIDDEVDLAVCAVVATPQAGLEEIATSRPEAARLSRRSPLSRGRSP